MCRKALITFVLSVLVIGSVQAEVSNENDYYSQLKKIEAERHQDIRLTYERLLDIGKSRDKFNALEQHLYELLLAHSLVMNGHVEKATSILEQLVDKAHNVDIKARAHGILAGVYHHQGKNVKAFTSLDFAINLLPKVENEYYEIAILANAVGTYKDSELLEFSMEYARKLLNKANKSKEQWILCLANFELGAIELQAGSLDIAKQRLLLAQDYCGEVNNVIYQLSAKTGIIDIALNKNNLKLAESLLEELFPKVEDYGWQLQVAITNTQFAKLRLAQKKYKEAEVFAMEAYKISKRLKEHKRLERASSTLATIYAKLGDNSEAVKYYQEYMKLNLDNRNLIRQRKLAFDVAVRGKLD